MEIKVALIGGICTLLAAITMVVLPRCFSEKDDDTTVNTIEIIDNEGGTVNRVGDIKAEDNSRVFINQGN